MDGNLTPTQKGNIAETAIVAAAYRLGIHVSRPLGEGQRYDLVFDWGDRLERIQCKWARRKGDVLVVHLSGCRHTPAGYVRRVYRQHEIDAVVAFSPDLGPLATTSRSTSLPTPAPSTSASIAPRTTRLSGYTSRRSTSSGL